MKSHFATILIGIAAIAMIFGVVYTMRAFSAATTRITLHEPKPGVTCAAMVTSDGAAISCWKD